MIIAVSTAGRLVPRQRLRTTTLTNMDFDPTALPRVLSTQQADHLGFTRDARDHLVDSGRWRRILPHTYLTSDTLTWLDQLRAAVVFAGPGALLSGMVALDGLGMRSYHRPASVLVLVPPGRQPRNAGWVQVRPSARPMARAMLPGAPRVNIARAVADACLGQRHQDDVRALVAEAVRLGLCTIDELAYEVRHGPRRGSAFLREAVDEVGGGAWSAPEARAAKLLRTAHVPPFKQNVDIQLPGGGWYTADFLWIALRAILEIDSSAHHSLAGDDDHTSDRHLLLETLGYSTVHRTPRQIVKMPAQFTRGITAWLAARAIEIAS